MHTSPLVDSDVRGVDPWLIRCLCDRGARIQTDFLVGKGWDTVPNDAPGGGTRPRLVKSGGARVAGTPVGAVSGVSCNTHVHRKVGLNGSHSYNSS